MLYDDDYFEVQIESIAKINNNLESGNIEIKSEDKTVSFCIEFHPRMKYSEFTEYYFMDSLKKLVFYGQDVLDTKFGDILNESLVYWWTE